jgi:hypothetical protein
VPGCPPCVIAIVELPDLLAGACESVIVYAGGKGYGRGGSRLGSASTVPENDVVARWSNLSGALEADDASACWR